MTEPVEKAKRKSKPRVDRYSQNEAFAVIVFSLAVMLFFWLDELIGAVALKQYALWVALATTVLIPIIFLTLAVRWGKMRLSIAIGILIILVLGAIFGYVVIGSGIVLIAWVAMILIWPAIPLLLLGVWTVIVYTVACLLHMEEKITNLRSPMKTRTWLVLVSTFVVAIAMGYVTIREDLVDHIAIHDKNYYLILSYPPLDPTMANVYECNRLSMGCTRIHSGHIGYEEDVWLERDDSSSLLLLDRGQVVFDSSEDRE